jgi:hypothetical protein
VRFRFTLTNGKLYAFWVSPETTGASHGYVAAGGPGIPVLVQPFCSFDKFTFLWLFLFVKEKVTYYQIVHFGRHKTPVCIIRTTYDGFTTYIKAGVYKEPIAGFLPELF